MQFLITDLCLTLYVLITRLFPVVITYFGLVTISINAYCYLFRLGYKYGNVRGSFYNTDTVCYGEDR